jgi:DNA-binding response OmpR family regulator
MQNTALESAEINFRTQISVLIVEDDDQIAYLLEYLFKRQDYEVTIAVDGKQCLEIITNQQQPDLVIMDVNLPYINGFDLVREIRTNKGWEQTKIVMLTSMHEEKDIVHGLNIGADEFISKPFQPLELMARVAKIVQKSSAE